MGDGDQPDPLLLGIGRDVLGEGQPAPAAGGHQPELGVVIAELGQQRGDLSFEGRPVDRQVERSRGTVQPVEVLAQREGPAAVHADHLEDAVTPQKAVISSRNRGGVPIGNSSIDAG